MVIDKILEKLFRRKEKIDVREIERRARIYKFFGIKTGRPKKDFNYRFEQWCKASQRILRIRPTTSTKKKLKEAILTTGLDVTPTQVFSLTILVTVGLFLLIIPLMLLPTAMKVFFPFFPLIIGYLLFTYPSYLAIVTKIRAADESIKVILYMVVYLRFNPHLEGALNFAAEHCHGPIGRDLREILWGLESGEYITFKQAISHKMEKWLVWDKEFVESMNLLLSLERIGTEQIRKQTLNKSLNYILESTYQKMMDYSRDLRTPMTMIHSMGITFPLMGLVMFPMISIFMHDQLNPFYIGFGYTIVLPLLLYWYLKRTIAKRPGAFAFPDISHHPDLPPMGKYRITFNKRRYYIPVVMTAIIVGFFLCLPGLTHFGHIYSEHRRLAQNPLTFQENWKDFLEIMYRPDVLFILTFYSLSIVWGVGLGLAIYFLGMSYQRLKIRNEIKMIEDEFQVALFNLSDVLSSGIPVETALEEVAHKYRQSKMDTSPMYTFFIVLIRNMKNLGMTLERAIFDKQYGGILRYPSVLINDIMKIVISASRKSSEILSIATRSISTFLAKTKNVEALIKDVLDEISSAVQLQATFIAPFICGIVATMGTFIVELLQKIAEFLRSVEETFNMGGSFVHGATIKFGETLGMINIEEVMPPTLFQLIVGIYMIEVVMILAYFLNGIKNGFDVTSRNVLIGKTLLTALIFYSILLLISLFLTRSLIPIMDIGV